MPRNASIQERVGLGAFFILNLAGAALIVMGLLHEDWAYNSAEVAYQKSDETWSWTTSWNLLGGKVSSPQGGIPQPDPRRPKLTSFYYADCATIPIPVECNHLYGTSLGCLIIGGWAVISSIASVAIGLYFFKTHHGAASWTACSFASLLSSCLVLAAVLLWGISGIQYISDFYPRLFSYEVVKAAILHQSTIHLGIGIWFLAAGAAACLFSIPCVYMSRRCFDTHSYSKFQQQYGNNGELIPIELNVAGTMINENVVGANPDFTSVLPSGFGNFERGDSRDIHQGNYGANQNEQVTSTAMEGFFSVRIQELKMMTTSQVSAWFRSIGMSEDTCQIVALHSITGLSLLTVNPNVLRHTFPGDGPKIMDLIDDVRAQAYD